MKGLQALIIFSLLSLGQTAVAGDVLMNNTKMGALLKRFDPELQGEAGSWRGSYEEIAFQVITSETADRMRIIVPVAETDGLDKEMLYRLMQANFDTALDARYAIAQGVLWATFIHPMSPLDEDEFFSGLAQTITLASSFGSTYSSGALRFGGGDSGEALEKAYQRILNRAKAI